MLPYFVIAILATAGATDVEIDPSLNITNSFRFGSDVPITISVINDPYWIQVDGPGIVNGFRSCGGYGTLYTIRYETCSGDHSQVCRVPGDNLARPAELHFSASQDISQVAVRVFVSARGIPLTLIFEKALPNVVLYRGYKYSINADIAADVMFKGKKVTLQFELVARDADFVEICGAADFEIV